MRIAHLSDVHILAARDDQRASYRLRTKLVSLGRGGNPRSRADRLARALAKAKALRADHVVISGDLTEVGAEAEFEHFAEILHAAGMPADSVTLVPGNHDAYSAADGWARAMAGPLARFAPSSATVAGKVVDRGPVALLPVDSSFFQNIARSAGEFSRATADAVSRSLVAPSLRDKALVLVLHHPPFHPNPLLKVWDGLRGCSELLDLLARNPRLQLLHGHLHRVFDRILAGRGPHHTEPAEGSVPTRMFGAPATCDDPENDPQIRMYDVESGVLRAVPPGRAA